MNQFMVPDRKEMEKHRKYWARIAIKNKWNTKPFFVSVWVNRLGRIVDSVSHRGMSGDVITQTSGE